MGSVLLALWLALAVGPLAAAERPANLVVHVEAKPLPELRFVGANNRPRRLVEFQSKVVLLNLWATWCMPCRTEMPALDRLQATLGGEDFEW